MDFDRQLERHRAYLLMLAKMQFHRALQGRLDPSDIVQETLQEAHRQRSQIQADNSAQLAGWLRKALRNNLIDAARMNGRAKNAVDREQALEAMDRSSLRLEGMLADSQTTPSEHLCRHERLVAMAVALEKLPDDQAEAVRLKHLQGYSLKEIAAKMDRSPSAVAGLLHRGLTRLRELMEQDGDASRA